MLLLLASACTSSGSLPAPGRGANPPGPPLTGAPIAFPASAEAIEILALEEARDPGDGRLVELLRESGDEAVRARAAQALGRMPFPEHGSEVTTPLCEALGDPSPVVRAAAAFALDCRSDPAAAGVILSFWRDPDATVRARLVRAAGRVHTQPVRTQVLRAMQDPALVVRQAAVAATALWPSDLPDAGDTDSALLGTLSPFPDASGRRVAPDPELVWLSLFALARRGSEKGRGAFIEHGTDADPRARIFAVRGLSALEPDPGSERALGEALYDRDWRVSCEAAVGLGRAEGEGAVPLLLSALSHPSTHVRARVLEGLGRHPARANEILPAVWRAGQDLSGTVRSAALAALARLSDGAEGARLLGEGAKDRDPVVRGGVADAAAACLESFRAIPLLESLAHDPDPFVAARALEGLAGHPTPRSRAILLEFLESSDNGLRLTAVLGLAREGNARPADVPALARALRTSTGDVADEVAFEAVKVLGALGGDAAREAVVETLDHDDPHVRRVARQVLERDFGLPPDTGATPLPARGRTERRSTVPGRDFPVWTRNPVADVVTSRGTMTFELLAAEAPLHVHNFVALARRGAYDGLKFHRVVPDFVVQGGDYRGDGNGARSWNGGSLPHEFTPRPFERGALGMPRNEDFDSGGGQFFVTHRATPHLDGRYTLFGLLRAGGDTLDAIEVGDAILEVRVYE